MRTIGNIGFEDDITDLFTERDLACMNRPRFFLDLHAWATVVRASDDIWSQLESRKMPPPNGWSSDKIEAFQRWRQEGMPKRRTELYAAYFRDLDSWTEYWPFYRPESKGRYFFGDGAGEEGLLGRFFPNRNTPQGDEPLERWQEWAKFGTDADDDPYLTSLMEAIGDVEVKEALYEVDALLGRLIVEHFEFDGAIDGEAYIDCVENFARDQLPPDQDRFERVPEGDPRKDHSLYHTMDGNSMWFNWVGHLECTSLLKAQEDTEDEGLAVRTLAMAGICLGCPMDYVFRQRSRTRSEYRLDQPKRTQELLRSRARIWRLDWNAAAKEARALFKIREFGEETA